MYTQEQKDKLFRAIMDGIAIRCKTKDQSYALSVILDNARIRWRSGKSMLQRRVWDDYEERTAYNYEADSEGMMYATVRWYKEHGYTVVNFDEILTSEPTVSLMEYMSL